MSVENYELFTGTPNELARVSKGTLMSVKTKAKNVLNDMQLTAKRFDLKAVPFINEASEGLNSIYSGSIRAGEIRTWTFDYMSIRFTIELRRTT